MPQREGTIKVRLEKIDKADFFNPEHWETVPIFHNCQVCDQRDSGGAFVNAQRGWNYSWDGYLCAECFERVREVLEGR